MHELHLVRTLIAAAEQSARADGAESISVIRLRLGALCGVSAAQLRWAFELLVPGTRAAAARLELSVSEDVQDPDAQQVRLAGVEVPA